MFTSSTSTHYPDAAPSPAYPALQSASLLGQGFTWRERVDPSVEQAVATLFPDPAQAATFLAHTLRFAQAKQPPLPFLSIQEAKAVAVICVQRTRDLACMIGWSHETTNKYLLIFQALGLLRKVRHGTQIYLLFSLAPYHPSPLVLSNLEALIRDYRPKVQRLAKQVRTRLTLHYPSSIAADAPEAQAITDLHASLQEIRALLQAQGIEPAKAQTAALLITTNVIAKMLVPAAPTAQRSFPDRGDGSTIHDREDLSPVQGTGFSPSGPSTLQGRLPARSGDSPAIQEDSQPRRAHTADHFSEPGLQAQERLRVPGGDAHSAPSVGSLCAAGVDSPQNQGEAGGRRSKTRADSPVPAADSVQQKGDSRHGQAIATGRFSSTHGDSPVPAADSRQQTVDSPQRKRGAGGSLSGRRADSPPSAADSVQERGDSPHSRAVATGRFSSTHGDSPVPAADSRQQTVDSCPFPNVNVLSLVESLTSNVQTVALFCCRAFGESPSQRRVYLKLFRECHHDTRAITAALLYTQVHQRDGTMRNPAAVFMARCRDYHREGVSDEAAALVERYGHLTYQQFLDALQHPVSPTGSPGRAAASTAAAAAPPTPLGVSPLPRWGTVPRLIPAEAGKSGMSRAEALQVIEAARQNRRTAICRIDLERLADGSYAVLLDNTVTTIPRQTYIYAVQEWQTRTAAIKDCFELFGVAPRRSLRELLQERGGKR